MVGDGLNIPSYTLLPSRKPFCLLFVIFMPLPLQGGKHPDAQATGQGDASAAVFDCGEAEASPGQVSYRASSPRSVAGRDLFW